MIVKVTIVLIILVAVVALLAEWNRRRTTGEQDDEIAEELEGRPSAAPEDPKGRYGGLR